MDHKDVCFEIENDDFFRQYFSNASKKAVDKAMSASEKIDMLNKGIEKLNLELESQVISKHHDLLTQASHATTLEKAIGVLQIESQGLLTGIEKLRTQVLTPYDMLENQTSVLSRIQKVCHIMRQAAKIIDYCKGLKELDKNPSLQATLIYEVEQTIDDGDFEGLDILVDELETVRTYKARIIENASKNLQLGLSNGDKSVLIHSFNIFSNLHVAKDVINDLINSELNYITLNVQNAFNVQQRSADTSKGGPGKINITNPQNFKQQLWENIEKLFNECLYSSCKKIILLQSCLVDLHTLENYRYVAKGFWNNLSNIFSLELKKSSITANQCIELDFPRLLKCYNELCNKLHYKQFAIKRDTLSAWENTFLSKSLTKLLDPVRSMWQMSHVPTLEQVDEAVRAISNALSVALGDKQLSLALATSVAKCIKQMSTEAEQRICMDADAGQVIEAPTSSQTRNAALSNILFYFSKKINRVIMNMLTILSAESINIIQESLKDISCVGVLQPFCVSIKSAIDLILGSMHSEPEPIKVDVTTITSCSLYMRELQQFLSRCRNIYLCLYDDRVALNGCSEEIAKHCSKTFLYNVCCLRPITDYRRRKLYFDYKQLLIILSAFTSHMDYPNPFEELRTIHILLSLAPMKIAEHTCRTNTMPHSLVMLLLFAFAGPDLLSPHQCAGWSNRQLVDWLHEHKNERERVEFIAGALQRYVNHVNQHNITKYDDMYPLLLQLLDEARKFNM